MPTGDSAEPAGGIPAGPGAETPTEPAARPAADPAANPAEPSAGTAPETSVEPAAGQGAENPAETPVSTPAQPSVEPVAGPWAEPSAEASAKNLGAPSSEEPASRPSAGPAAATPPEPSSGTAAKPSAETPRGPRAAAPTDSSAGTPADSSAGTPVGPSAGTPVGSSDEAAHAGPSAGIPGKPPLGPRSEATADQHPHGPDTSPDHQTPESATGSAAGRATAPPPSHDEPRALADTHDAHQDPSGNGGRRARGRGRPPRRPPEQPRGGLLMGRPFGVPVYVAPSWFLVAALITWVFGGQLDRVLPELGAARYLVSLFFAVAFYASVLIHELAHTVAALRFKLPVRRIQLQFFGGVSEIEKEAETPGREFWLAFVGPLLSLALAGVFYLAMQPVEPGTVPGVLLAGLMISNLIVAIFNLLPGLPLDGGRMLRAVVWKITGKPMSGTVAAAWVGRALAVSVLIGLPLLTQSGALGAGAEDSVGMDTVTDALLAAILAAIIWTGAGNSLRMARLREHLPELRARTLTRRAVPVETHTPLSEALRRANDAGARALVVVDAHGEPLSLVREAAIVGVPEHRRPWVAVSGLAQDLTDGMRVSAELAGEDLLDVLRATPATEYLVVEETGEIYGVLSAADVERAFVKAMARPN
ncbi:site-2 protease family protein [Streptomyces antibioticus]|uniref:site-2 protease family protein n=1 Tax=Streptomyces antibioticus TaxID=1890 RepID=UPI0037122B1C